VLLERGATNEPVVDHEIARLLEGHLRRRRLVEPLGHPRSLAVLGAMVNAADTPAARVLWAGGSGAHAGFARCLRNPSSHAGTLEMRRRRMPKKTLSLSSESIASKKSSTRPISARPSSTKVPSKSFSSIGRRQLSLLDQTVDDVGERQVRIAAPV